MRSVSLFVEDFGHEEFLKALLYRVAGEYGIEIRLRSVSVRGGHGKVISELRRFMRDLQRGGTPLPDLLVIAIDSNCKGHAQRKKEIDRRVPPAYAPFAIMVIPDPHIERWMLVDSAAFKAVFGKGCQAPDHKCDKDRYKKLLIEAIKQADASIPLRFGGFEFAREIVRNLDIKTVRDASLQELISDVTTKFKQWSRQ